MPVGSTTGPGMGLGAAPLDKTSRIGFVGSGIVGRSMAAALSRQGYVVCAAASRSLSSAQELARLVDGARAYEEPQAAIDASDVVFITTPDDAIGAACASYSWSGRHTVVHCSGVSSLDVLGPAVEQGARAGSIHPMQAFASVENGIASIPGATFGIEGDDEVRAYLRRMALDVGGHPVFLEPEDKALYHLSGVMMGGLLSGIAAAASQLWEHIGHDRARGVQALMPMMRQVSQNLATAGVPAGLAGPYARGDVGTVRKHLEVLHERSPDTLPLYCHMGLAGLPFALEKGTISQERYEQIRGLLEEYLARSSPSPQPSPVEGEGVMRPGVKG